MKFCYYPRLHLLSLTEACEFEILKRGGYMCLDNLFSVLDYNDKINPGCLRDEI